MISVKGDRVLGDHKRSLLNLSVDFLHGRTTTASTRHSSTRHAPRHVWHTAFTTTCSLVDFHHDRVHYPFELLLLCFEFILLCQLVLVQPIQGVLHGFLDLVLVASFEFFLECVAHREAIIFQTVLSFDLALVRLVLGTVLL